MQCTMHAAAQMAPMALMRAIFPALVAYVHHVRQQVPTAPVAFVARDGYVLKLIHDRVYPDLPADYLYCSRTCYEEATPEFVSYAKRYLNHVWVDGNGSSRTHVKFFTGQGLPIPRKILFTSLVTDRTDDHVLSVFYSDRFLSRGPFTVSLWECVMRAPHGRVLGIDRKGQPVFDTANTSENTSGRQFVRMYKRLVRTLGGPGFVPRSTKAFKAAFKVLALDLDNCVVGAPPDDVRQVLQAAQLHNVKVVVVTARQDPDSFTEPPYAAMLQHCDLFYFEAAVRTRRGVAMTKALQLGRAAAGSPALLVDDNAQNCSVAREFGHRALRTTKHTFHKALPTILQFIREKKGS